MNKALAILMIAVMVFGGIGAAAAHYFGEPNIPDNAIFTKTGSNTEVTVGETISYTVTVKNPNTGGAEDNFYNVEISDTVPNGLEVTNVEGGTNTGNAVSADIGTLAPGESNTIVITVKAKTKGKYTNTAYLEYNVKETKKVHYRHSNSQNQYNQQNHNEQEQQNCCENQWTTNCQHKNDKCCKLITKCVQRTDEASADPLIVDPVKSKTPAKPIKAQEETVGMQETGVPILPLLLAGLMLFSGMLLPKRK